MLLVLAVLLVDPGHAPLKIRWLSAFTVWCDWNIRSVIECKAAVARGVNDLRIETITVVGRAGCQMGRLRLALLRLACVGSHLPVLWVGWSCRTHRRRGRCG